ncbi:MAG TPA: sialidase family protein [Nitrososphaerales archaeon]|nr:sialidase family protein [Nitrososphaerales archaeon]
MLPVKAASTATFNPAINLSNDTSSAKDATISNNGQNVYVAWTEGSKGVLFRMSPDGGNTWVPPTSHAALRISPKGGTTMFPVMFTQFQSVNSGDVYVTWAQTVTQANGSKILQIFVAASTNNGVSFTTTQLSHNSTHSQNTPAIAAAGSNVYVAWFSGKNATARGSVYVSSSNDNGKTWSTPVDPLNPSSAGEPEIVASGSNVYLVGDGIGFTVSTDSGKTWSTQVNLFKGPRAINSTSVYYGREPWLSAMGNNVYVVWEANSTTPGISYHDQAVTSVDGGITWGPTQNVSDPLRDNWEPESSAYSTSDFMTFHSLQTQGVYVTTAANVISNTPTWGTSKLLSPTKLKSSFGHIFTSDGVNVFVMWGQQISTGSSTWDAYIASSSNGGTTWNPPVNISNNAVGVAAGNVDVTLFALSSNGANCFAAWTYTNGGTSQIYFASS